MRSPLDTVHLRVVIVLAGVLGVTGCKSTPSDRSVQPGDAELVAQTLATVSAMDRLRGETMASAEGKLHPRPDLGVCPVKYDSYESPKSALPNQPKEANGILDIEPWDAARGNDLLGNIGDELASIQRLGIAFGREVASKPGPRSFRAMSDARDGARSDYDRTRLRELADKTKSPNDYELVIDQEVAPKITSETEFEPGLLKGRFYVWDHDKGVIACMARVLVLSSEKLRIKVRSDSAGKKEVDDTWERGMRSDLRDRALEQARTRLFIAGPLPTEGDDDLNDGGADSGKVHDASTADAGARRDGGRGGPLKMGTSDGGKP